MVHDVKSTIIFCSYGKYVDTYQTLADKQSLLRAKYAISSIKNQNSFGMWSQKFMQYAIDNFFTPEFGNIIISNLCFDKSKLVSCLFLNICKFKT